MTARDITVVVPYHNEETYIHLPIESILAQTQKPHEVIFVDNASSDSTRATISRFIPQFETHGISVKLLDEKQKGRVYARICGFEAVKTRINQKCDRKLILRRHFGE